MLAEGGGEPVVIKYYYFNGQRVAMRKGGVLYYLAADHLGTTSVVMDDQGSKVAESRHYPYGQERWRNGTLPTGYRFTGQRSVSSVQLTVMGARWYDAYINRFISPDTIIPQPGNPQSLNRETVTDWGHLSPRVKLTISGFVPGTARTLAPGSGRTRRVAVGSCRECWGGHRRRRA